MTIRNMLRGLLGKRREDATPSSKATPAQPTAAKEVTEQELEQVQGGAGLPITSYPPVTWPAGSYKISPGPDNYRGLYPDVVA